LAGVIFQYQKMSKAFPYRYRVLILLLFLMLVTYLDRVCISLLGVRIKSAFSLNNEQFGWALGAFSLAYALFEIPAGIWGDRIGQRASLLRIVMWWSIFTALTGATTGLITLIGARLLFGMGEAGAFPNSTGVISRWFPAAETARSVSFLFVGVNAGAAIAPLIIIPLAAAFGWRATFFVNGFIGLIWVLMCFLWFRNDPSLMKGITAGERSLIENTRRYINHSKPFLWKKTLKKRNIWVMMASFFCSQWGLYFFIAWMPVYLQEGRHFSENEMKNITSVLFAFGILSALLTGWLSDGLVKTRGLTFARRYIGTLALCIEGTLIFFAGIVTSNTAAVVCLVAAYFFLWPFSITAFATCVDIGGDNTGTVTGIMNFSGQLGAFIFVTIFGKIVDKAHSFNTPLFLLAAILLAGGLIWLTIDPVNKIAITDD
jgi:ACS family glucarate transporter-like MFS transporter